MVKLPVTTRFDIKKSGGITCRVERGPRPVWYDYASNLNKGPGQLGWALAKVNLEEHKVHASEYSSVGLDYDFYVDNSGSVDELHRKIDSIINL